MPTTCSVPTNMLRDLNNLVLLRSDIHTQFDNRKLVFFPKAANGFAVHVLQPMRDLLPIYHNTPVEVSACAPEFLLARFAWAIFSHLVQLSRPYRSLKTDRPN